MKKKYLIISCVEDIYGDRDSFDDMWTDLLILDSKDFESVEAMDEAAFESANAMANDFAICEWYADAIANGKMTEEQAKEKAAYLIIQLPKRFMTSELEEMGWYEYLDENVPDWDENF